MSTSVREPPQTEYCYAFPGISPPPTGILSEMNAAQLAFYVAISLAGVAFVFGATHAARHSTTVRWPTPVELVIGFVTDFFDTLGIGSFASTTAIYKLRRIVPDELIPGTLNVGHTPSAIGFAVGINFVLGALMSAGIGLYAPCMITPALLGMHPLAAFPIMMGACALLQPVASLRFFQTGKFAMLRSAARAEG